MLLLPPIDQINDVTIYADTDLDYQFYGVPNVPRLRYGPDGKPVFEFLKYREDASRMADDPHASRGGGYIQFDTELVVPDAVAAQHDPNLARWYHGPPRRRQPHDGGALRSHAQPLPDVVALGGRRAVSLGNHGRPAVHEPGPDRA